MVKSKLIDKICLSVIAFAVIITVLFMNSESLGISKQELVLGYENRLFDDSTVHTIDIVMNESDWENFIETAENEEYVSCSLVIDGESFKNVAIRAKGNSSLSQVASYGNDRYSFKIEFDHYDSNKTYYGLDKLVLNNIQDNSYLKDYITYKMMNYIGAKSSLSSFVWITINGEDWGLYTAIEAVEDSFLERNYGNTNGNLYKPDSMDMNGGGNREMPQMNQDNRNREDFGEVPFEMPEDFDFKDAPFEMPEDFNFDENNNQEREAGREKGGFGAGSGTTLSYIDDNIESYSVIFDNAKSDITETDKKRLISSLKQLSENENLTEILDIENTIKYFAAHIFVCNSDSYTGNIIHNYYLYEENGKMTMLPWDYNLAFGGMGSSDITSEVNSPIDTPVSGDITERPMAAWIFNNPEYLEMYHEYFSEFIQGYFESGEFEEMIDSAITLISPYVEKDPTSFCTYEEFQEACEVLKEFCLLRAESVKGQLDGSIPSTSEGQKADNSSLIDASSISLSSTGGFGKGGFEGRDKNMNMRNENTNQEPDINAFKEQANTENAPPGGNEANKNAPGQASANSIAPAADNNTKTIALSAASAVVLIAGLIFAAKFKR